MYNKKGDNLFRFGKKIAGGKIFSNESGWFYLAKS